MVVMVILFIFCLIIFNLGVWALSEKKESIGSLFFVVGLLFLSLTTFVIAPVLIPSGLPETSLDAGEYKAAFVYVAGENVNVGVEKKDGENERLYLYQFPKSAFDGSINSSAKKLVVVESGGFRKLVLK